MTYYDFQFLGIIAIQHTGRLCVVRSFGVRRFGVLAFGVSTFGVLAFGILTFGVSAAPENPVKEPKRSLLLYHYTLHNLR